MLSGLPLQCPRGVRRSSNANRRRPGMIFSMSYVSIPALRDIPAPMAAKVWRRTYDIGKATAPPFAVASAVCFGYLASQCQLRSDTQPNAI